MEKSKRNAEGAFDANESIQEFNREQMVPFDGAQFASDHSGINQFQYNQQYLATNIRKPLRVSRKRTQEHTVSINHTDDFVLCSES